jgi:alpha-beta hydrolase superfamily lysophospholipase
MKLFLILATVILILLSFTIGYGLYYIAPYGIVLIDRLPRTQIAKLFNEKIIPENYGLKSESLKVTAGDSISLRGWFIFSQKISNKTIILLHGIRAGKEQMLPMAYTLSNAGFNTVIFDSRAHGESGGKYCTFGYYEKNDISKIIDLLKKRDSSQIIGIYGSSLGGAIALQAMEHDSRIKCGVIESTFATLREVINEYMKNMFFLRSAYLSNIVLDRAAEMAKFNPDDVQPEINAKNIYNPVFVAHGDKDKNINFNNGKRIFHYLKSANKELHLVKGANHFNVFSYGGKEYQNKIINFLNRNLANN